VRDVSARGGLGGKSRAHGVEEVGLGLAGEVGVGVVAVHEALDLVLDAEDTEDAPRVLS
jgi:hypothetical protein